MVQRRVLLDAVMTLRRCALEEVASEQGRSEVALRSVVHADPPSASEHECRRSDALVGYTDASGHRSDRGVTVVGPGNAPVVGRGFGPLLRLSRRCGLRSSRPVSVAVLQGLKPCDGTVLG